MLSNRNLSIALLLLPCLLTGRSNAKLGHVRKNRQLGTSCGSSSSLVQCFVREISTGRDIPIVDNVVVVVRRSDYSLRCETSQPMHRVEFQYRGMVHTERLEPYYMAGDRWGKVRTVTDFCSVSQVTVTGRRGNDMCFATTMSTKCTPPPLPGKKGAAFTLRETGIAGSWEEHLPKVIALRPYWNYSWGSQRIPQQPNDIEFVPMIWGQWDVEQRIATTVMEQIDSGQAKRVLGFNEPDKLEQSNIPVATAVEEWAHFDAIRDKVSLISPSAAQPHGAWMQSFLQAPGVLDSIDWVGVHWYSDPNVAQFQQRMRQLYHMYGRRPLLITEFAVADWQAETVEENRYITSSDDDTSQVLAFMKQVLPWLEATPWIAGYVWFSFPRSSAPGACSALFDMDGNLTALGKFYASVRTENPTGGTS